MSALAIAPARSPRMMNAMIPVAFLSSNDWGVTMPVE